VNLRETLDQKSSDIEYDFGITNTPETSSEIKFEGENESIMIEIKRMEGGNLASQPGFWPLNLDPGLSTWTLASQPGPWPLNQDFGLSISTLASLSVWTPVSKPGSGL
jgi:hypothetical protein